jgi:hypothetical protein
MVTPRSEGGPTENDPSPNSENDHAKERDGMNDSDKKKIVEQADKEELRQAGKRSARTAGTKSEPAKIQGQVQFVRGKGEACGLRSSTKPISRCSRSAPRKCRAAPRS